MGLHGGSTMELDVRVYTCVSLSFWSALVWSFLPACDRLSDPIQCHCERQEGSIGPLSAGFIKAVPVALNKSTLRMIMHIMPDTTPPAPTSWGQT